MLPCVGMILRVSAYRTFADHWGGVHDGFSVIGLVLLDIYQTLRKRSMAFGKGRNIVFFRYILYRFLDKLATRGRHCGPFFQDCRRSQFMLACSICIRSFSANTLAVTS